MLFELGILAFSGYVTAQFHQRIMAAIAAAPCLTAPSTPPPRLPTVAVIIPAYNEALNLRECVESVLHSKLPDPQQMKVWIADDESTDRTGAIARELVAQDSRVRHITVPPRPTDEVWLGKTWACTQAAALVQEDYLLFIDADVRLMPGAVSAALADAEHHQADLLSAMPQVICGCFAEWLAQPIIFRMLIASFDPKTVNDPTQENAFAAGPFMLFRRAAYEHIGGHRSVADDLVEDVALARQIKRAGRRMHLILGFEFVQVRMYRSFAALWEGWTKNFHMGTQRRLSATLKVPLVALASLTLPWLILGYSGLSLGMNAVARIGIIEPGLPLLIAVGLLIWQRRLWHQQAQGLQQPVRYWSLSWLGGLFVSAIAIGSIIKTETGWGWTWRGRSLVRPNAAQDQKKASPTVATHEEGTHPESVHEKSHSA
jgi:cellulose synthase/poly-beta-1,6-N-acetylglucosamine synthase-like glycosyltransferase